MYQMGVRTSQHVFSTSPSCPRLTLQYCYHQNTKYLFLFNKCIEWLICRQKKSNKLMVRLQNEEGCNYNLQIIAENFIENRKCLVRQNEAFNVFSKNEFIFNVILRYIYFVQNTFRILQPLPCALVNSFAEKLATLIKRHLAPSTQNSRCQQNSSLT